jgi:FlaA1/EpsC-like NDP-sugar epimerase
VLLWGAGDLGAQLARRLLDHAEEGLVPAGFVDDDPRKHGRLIHGLRVHGDSSHIPELIDGGLATVVVVTSPRVSSERIANVAARIGASKVRRVRLLLEEVTMAMPPALTPAETRSVPR